MSEGSENKVDVLIQGAGIGGLTLAIALIQRGYSIQVVERTNGLSEIGAGIWMAANPMQVFDRLGFADKVTDAGWMMHRLTLEDYRGEVIQVSDISAIAKLFGFETIALHRSVLQKVLFQQLPAETVRFNTEVKTLSQRSDSVSVQLTDGTSITAKIVVGADGINSQIRALAGLGGEKRYSGSSSYRAIAKGAQLLPAELDHDAYEIWGKGCRVGFSKINANDYYWYMTFDNPAGQSFPLEQKRSHAASLFRDYFPRWTGLLTSTHTEDILQTDISDLKRLNRWSSGRVGLIGDAAHATTPNLGQGGAMAIEDALSLTNAFRKVGFTAEAFELYAKQRREKVDWTVSTSWSIGKMCHIRNPLGRSVRNAVLKLMLSRSSEKQIQKLYSIQ
ncbi:FAD-dependent monooxygenase [Edaphobacter flagellatus]|uniref:FAD-dependent monooxygenase n=1 Tax=Edaphobacter flagellatus TaxID=1933044 RepID=UPI0021B273B0|nr:FAD-dependent monooxygenase [Edaphobacter flagellatus]